MVHSSKEPELSQDFKNVKSFKIGPGTTRLGRFEWSRLNHPLPIIMGMVLRILMIIKKIIYKSNIEINIAQNLNI